MAKKIIKPTEEEDAAINAGVASDRDASPTPDGFWTKAKMGRPPMATEKKKKRINITLDQEVAAALDAYPGKASALINDLLRDRLKVG